jgi:hypothetical protein
MYDFPEVTEEFLVHKLKTDHQPYGVFDYCLFLARPLYHLLGMSTSNAKGQICSEMCNNDLRESGVSTPFTEVPSPAELYRWLDSSPVHSHRKIQIL